MHKCKRMLVVALVMVAWACEAPPTAVAVEPIEPIEPIEPVEVVAELLEIQLVFDFQCRFGGLRPEHTFTASVFPDTLEIAYELVSHSGDWVWDKTTFSEMAGVFTDTLFTRWNTAKREQRVEFVLSHNGWRVEGVTRCTVN